MSIEEKILTLLRGVSGSGKTQRANELRPHGGVVISTDDFFTDDKGNYKFDYSKISQAHDVTRAQVEAHMTMGKNIIVDNTNTRWWEMMPYLEMAKKFDYTVRIVMCGSLKSEFLEHYAERNKHGTPLEVVQRQASNFEKLMDPKAAYLLEKLRQEIVSMLREE